MQAALTVAFDTMLQATGVDQREVRVRLKLEVWDPGKGGYVYMRGGSWVQLIPIPPAPGPTRWAARTAYLWTMRMATTLANLRREMRSL